MPPPPHFTIAQALSSEDAHGGSAMPALGQNKHEERPRGRCLLGLLLPGAHARGAVETLAGDGRPGRGREELGFHCGRQFHGLRLTRAGSGPDGAAVVRRLQGRPLCCFHLQPGRPASCRRAIAGCRKWPAPQGSGEGAPELQTVHSAGSTGPGLRPAGPWKRTRTVGDSEALGRGGNRLLSPRRTVRCRWPPGLLRGVCLAVFAHSLAAHGAPQTGRGGEFPTAP